MANGFRKSWLLILSTMCLLFCVSFLGIIPFFEKHKYATLFIGELTIFIPILMGMRMLKNEPRMRASVFKSFPLSLIPVLIILPFCMQVFMMYITAPLQLLLYQLFGERAETFEVAASMGELITQIVAVCLIPAIVEEFLCRGVIMRLLKPYGVVVVIVMSALAFSVLHFDLYSFVVIFMLGILLAVVKLLTGSIWACVLIHFSNNLLAVLSTLVTGKEMTEMAYAINILSFLAFPIAICFLMYKTKANALGIRNIKRKKIEFSPEMCVCILFFVGFSLFEALL